MKRYNTQGIVLARTDFGEADRILSFITSDHGKVKAIAKGVRKAKAKLAGSIELFSVSDLTLIPGKKDIDTLISARLVKHFTDISRNLEATSVAFECLKLIDKATEDQAELAYFEMLRETLNDLSSKTNLPQISGLWLKLQLLKQAGHSPNLRADRKGRSLKSSQSYNFHIDHMHFVPEESKSGQFDQKHIKFLRLGLSAKLPGLLQRVQGANELSADLQSLVDSMLRNYIRV